MLWCLCKPPPFLSPPRLPRRPPLFLFCSQSRRKKHSKKPYSSADFSLTPTTYCTRVSDADEVWDEVRPAASALTMFKQRKHNTHGNMLWMCSEALVKERWRQHYDDKAFVGEKAVFVGLDTSSSPTKASNVWPPPAEVLRCLEKDRGALACH